jgi:AraC-like DNA-binding protein
VDPHAEANGSESLSPALHGLLLDFPSITVLAALCIRPEDFRQLGTLGQWGVADLISLEHDATAETIGQLLVSVSGMRLRALLEEFLPPTLPGRARSILLLAADAASSGQHASDLADALGITRRTLLRWCEDAGLPAPRRIMAWMRILLAAEMLDEPGRTVASIAFACGYASDTALRTALNMQLGKTPKALRQQGAFVTASEAFLRELQLAQSGTGTFETQRGYSRG